MLEKRVIHLGVIFQDSASKPTPPQFMFDLEDDNSFEFSVLDKTRIEDLEIGDRMEAENDSFMILRGSNGYHIWVTNGKQRETFICTTLEKTFQFLENN